MAPNVVFDKMVSELGASLTGNIEKAIIVVHDYRNRGKQVMEQRPTINVNAKGVNGAVTTTTRARTMNDVATGFAIDRTEVMGNKLNSLSGSVTERAQSVLQGQNVTFPDAEDKMFFVQYNPSHLVLNVSMPPPGNVTNTADGHALLDINGTAKLQLTVELIFDEMSTYDAFMWDKFTANILTSTLSASAITNTVNAVKDSKKVFSVQPEVEALLSALRDQFTRTVSFRWADFTFIGSVETVRATYTMFSPSGRPIRAKVMLRITHEMDPKMLQSFTASRDLLFGDNNVGNLTQWNQNWQNLLNLNL